MPDSRPRRVAALLSIGALSAGFGAAAPAWSLPLGEILPDAGATLVTSGTTVGTLPLTGSLLPSPSQTGATTPVVGTIVTQTGATLGGLLPGAGGVVTGVTGSAGGAVGAIGSAATGTVDQALGAILGGGAGTLPDGVLSTLIVTLLGNSGAAPGTPGLGNPSLHGPIVLSGGSVGPGGVILDASAPRPKIRVLSRLSRIARTGRMRIEIATDEPGIIALGARVRPGAAVKARAKGADRGRRAKAPKRARHSRRVISIPRIVLGFRRAGRLVVTVRLSRAAQRTLGRSRSARMSAGTIAVDLFRNQAADSTRLRIRR